MEDREEDGKDGGGGGGKWSNNSVAISLTRTPVVLRPLMASVCMASSISSWFCSSSSSSLFSLSFRVSSGGGGGRGGVHPLLLRLPGRICSGQAYMSRTMAAVDQTRQRAGR